MPQHFTVATSGLLASRQFEERMGFTARFAACINDSQSPVQNALSRDGD